MDILRISTPLVIAILVLFFINLADRITDGNPWSSSVAGVVTAVALPALVTILGVTVALAAAQEGGTSGRLGAMLSGVHRWLAQAPIIVMLAVGVSIASAARAVVRGHESWLTTPVIALLAGAGAYFAATWIRYSYDARLAPSEPSDDEIAENVDRLLAEASAAIDQCVLKHIGSSKR